MSTSSSRHTSSGLLVEYPSWLLKKTCVALGLGCTSSASVKNATPLAEGWLKLKPLDHPVTRGLRSSLHVFGGLTCAADTYIIGC